MECFVSSSLRGAHASGVILSLVKTAEHNGLSATAYIQFLLEELPTLYDNGTLREKIQAYLPWYEEVQAKVAKIVYEKND